MFGSSRQAGGISCVAVYGKWDGLIFLGKCQEAVFSIIRHNIRRRACFLARLKTFPLKMHRVMV
ncbi:hypothetical protein TGS27_2845 [Geobacillus stearothermophilus]|nr:hypothetical protein TGS27_2845 [Geobacillus stearothermophilus]